MNESERLATTLDHHGLNESATLLRKQDAALKPALRTLQGYEASLLKFGLAFGNGYAAITTIQEVLK
jgi:hypothetical protein